MKTYLYLLIFALLPEVCSAQQTSVVGKVVDSATNLPLAGASIVVKGQTVGVTADSSGKFRLAVPSETSVLVTSFIGYQKVETLAGSTATMPLVIKMQQDQNQLKEVTISSGYQNIPKERATGSFVVLDENILNRRVGPDILSRLEDVTPGLVFNRSGVLRSGAQSAISIRGQSTLFAREDPLIVLDNFPYTGDLASINPNDIESVTVLKDAAAASIWGAQSGNGVIVITTKKGSFNQPAKVSFNSNLTIAQRPDQYYLSQMSSSDYIDIEKMLFGKGYYTSIEASDAKTALTPVVELLIAERDKTQTTEQVQQQISALRLQDVRADIDKYLNRQSVNQQYSLGIQGGSRNQRYNFSAGYDHGLANAVGNGSRRVTINAGNTYSFLNQKLQLSTMVYYTGSVSEQNALASSDLNVSSGKTLYPYARLVDQNGVPQNVTHLYRTSFVDQAKQKGLLDWTYNPIKETDRGDNSVKLNDYRINLSTRYDLTKALSWQVLYQYVNSTSERENRQSQENWYARDLINRFTVANTNGTLSYPIPVGDMLDVSRVGSKSQNLRTQLNFSGDLFSFGNLNGLAGAEIRQQHTNGFSTRYYGYDDQMATSSQVNYLTYYTSYVNPSSTTNRIPDLNSVSDLTDRYISYYANASYSILRRYIISASGRLDQSNLFGVNTNQKGVPLYSAGLAWKISEEKFYRFGTFPYLNLRATYGYNGNIDKSISAYTTAVYLGANVSGTGLPYAIVTNPPNPELRWERTRMINFGVDFKTINNRLSGSVEYYLKKGIDLIGNSPFAPQTGISSFRGNTSNTKGNGFDIVLSSLNLKGNFGWNTDLILSYSTDKVTRYLAKPTSIASAYLTGGSLVPAEGKPLYGVYSYRWAGLDPADGDPQGYLNGEVSKDYSQVKSSLTFQDLVYNGPLRPKYFGSIRNTFSYRGITASANISYRFGYSVRTSSVNYSTVLSGAGGHGDYALRWQKTGDEKLTHVPSMPEQENQLRTEFYTYSDVLVIKGDHIRFQDVNLSYQLDKAKIKKLFFNRGLIYLYANNLGLLWKKAKTSLDPDYVLSAPLPRSLSLGLKLEI